MALPAPSLGTVLLGFVILPGDSRDWWLNGLFIQDGRTGFVGWGGNQSLRAIADQARRLINAGTVPWVIAALLADRGRPAVRGLLDRAGHPMLGILATALVGLLDSPISWDHHWVWVVPGMMAAAHYAVARLAGGQAAPRAGAPPWPAALLLDLRALAGHPVERPHHRARQLHHGLIWAAPNTPVTKYIAFGDQPWFLEYHWRTFQLLAGNAYVLSGLLLLAILGFTALTAAPLAAAPAGPAVAAQAAPATPALAEPAAATDASSAGQGAAGEDKAGPAEPAAESDPARA